jgi:hypothetical protein
MNWFVRPRNQSVLFYKTFAHLQIIIELNF